MPSRYSDPSFWVKACDDAWAAAAKAFVAGIGAKAVGLTDVPWPVALNIAALAALVSMLTSIARAR
jgi:hypothetical protein